MLFNPNWKQPEVKADPFSLESLIAWLEKQPEEQAYCYADHGYCLLGQYFSAQGFDKISVYSNGVFTHGSGEEQYPNIFNSIAIDGNPFRDWMKGHDWTFGAALTRARKALADQH